MYVIWASFTTIIQVQNGVAELPNYAIKNIYEPVHYCF